MSSKFAGLALATEAPARLTLVHPVTGQPLRDTATNEEAWIDLLASSSAIGRTHDRGVTDRVTRVSGRRYSAEQALSDQIEKMAKLTRGWRLVSLDGQPLDVEFTLANARELYAMPEAAWMFDQAVAFVVDLANFRPASSTS